MITAPAGRNNASRRMNMVEYQRTGNNAFSIPLASGLDRSPVNLCLLQSRLQEPILEIFQKHWGRVYKRNRCSDV
ncbi:uncharacterized protein MYCFIDRAFT_205448 [Pseudocercospora fijiensis CIRAD86]|uniref:Uncharacterized protein n=1 Tax=Pseudocercospora fijiensis (strain CIRAD86) TaxID=383855 RepID=M2YHI5_PSEFD|nr:uncharacterized protein MYCFIDRAFT_205448 [Pseudocercospora fijiensis CIRAD86]EME77255.1 hypothetical protein MYCFIDRAFT_205448 [Pseudocercospora fijiensis CIRAD86]